MGRVVSNSLLLLFVLDLVDKLDTFFFMKASVVNLRPCVHWTEQVEILQMISA